MTRQTYTRPTTCSLTLNGATLPAMESEARKQFDAAFDGADYEITEIHAKLDMVTVDYDEWLPSYWTVNYEARART